MTVRKETRLERAKRRSSEFNSIRIVTKYGRLSVTEAAEKFKFNRDQYYVLKRKYKAKSPAEILEQVIEESINKKE